MRSLGDVVVDGKEEEAAQECGRWRVLVLHRWQRGFSLHQRSFPQSDASEEGAHGHKQHD